MKRPYIVGAVFSTKQLELVGLSNEEDLFTTGVLNLDLDKDSQGLQLLVRFLDVQAYQLGFQPPKPPDDFLMNGVW